MTSPTLLTLRPRTTEDLLAMLSGTMGFVPEESLMVALFREGRMEVSARLDLAGVRGSALGAWLEQFAAQFDDPELLVCAFTEDVDTGRALLWELLESVELRLLDALVADGRRWWSLAQEAAPAEGAPYDLSTSAMWAELILSGHEILPSRSELGRRLAGPDDDAAELFDEAAGLAGRATSKARAELQTRVRSWLEAPGPLEPLEAARLAVLVSDVDVRDIGLAMIDRSCAHELSQLWMQVVQQCPDAWAAGPLCILAVAGWASGRGVLQVVCMERLEMAAPTCTFLDLLDDINRAALPPAAWDAVVTNLRETLPGYWQPGNRRSRRHPGSRGRSKRRRAA